MTKRTYFVDNITCGHCTRTIEKELGLVDGVRSVRADRGAKSVTVEVADEGVLGAVEETLAEIGFAGRPA